MTGEFDAWDTACCWPKALGLSSHLLSCLLEQPDDPEPDT